jgi:(1->4)-alpha-D-glucan 1-alpha-D-glucosylmutase
MLYQTLVGAWPLELSPEDAEGLAAYLDRVKAWQTKALREAKRHTGWAAPNEVYEQACQDFLTQMLDPSRPSQLAHEVAGLVDRIAPAGCLNGLSQLILRVSAPGIPDLYQGTEFWDFSLVDPDNRRPVDFAAREASLREAAAPARLMPRWRDGRVKQAVLARALALRGSSGDLFTAGLYQRLKTEGPKSEHILAFARVHEGRAAIALVTRLAAKLPGLEQAPHVETVAWDETTVLLPRHVHGRMFHDVLGEADEIRGTGRLFVRDVLQHLPVSLLEAR